MNEAKGAKRSGRAAKAAQAVALFVPLILVNTFAVYGQAAWAHDHITSAQSGEWMRWPLAGLFACAVESIGVYLAVEAHAALMGDQASGLLRFGSYTIGVLAGGLNYWHFAGGRFAPNATAVTFALLSAISPWLWAIRSRALNRDRLRDLGLLDERGVKLSTSRKFWHPVLSYKVVRWAAWAGVKEPAAAVAGWAAANPPKPAKSPRPRSAAPAPQAASPAPLPGPTTPPATPAVKGPAAPARGRRGRAGGQRTTPQQRADALALVDEGKRPAEAALAVGVSKRTVEIWRKDRDEAAAASPSVAVRSGVRPAPDTQPEGAPTGVREPRMAHAGGA